MNAFALTVDRDASGQERSSWKLVRSEAGNTWDPAAKEWPAENVTGFISYDYKNKLEALSTSFPDDSGFPGFFFLDSEHPEYFGSDLHSAINACATNTTERGHVKLQCLITKEEYLKKVGNIKDHILRGDIYELNFCQKFEAWNTVIDPARVFSRLYERSHAPFAALMKAGPCYFIGASPERFLMKKGRTLLSQPMKGTAPRGETQVKDDQEMENLALNEKERSENIMITDLVRNDLSRIAKKASVSVSELCRVYRFKNVHQMISSISCELRSGVSFTDILQATFPMGSMTGAPKISAMRLIDRYEGTGRGLYSGAFGSISSSGDLDLSVAIRSIFYNEQKKYLSFMVGSAITAGSEPEREYEECMLKAKTMIEALDVDFRKFA